MSKAIVIGGGFYGSCLSLYLRAAGKEVQLIEKGAALLGRASLVNQARVHYGYHYPRSFITAARSAINFPLFAKDFSSAIDSSFEKYYAIAKINSKVSSSQFVSFCKKAGAPIKEAPKKVSSMFNQDQIESVFTVKEYAFDAENLRAVLTQRMLSKGVSIQYSNEAVRIERNANSNSVVMMDGVVLEADEVYLCAYSGINRFLNSSSLPLLPLKHEVAEIALVRHNGPLNGMGITVMDGPFFSTIPFPARKCHSFTHVRYTPHEHWIDVDPVKSPDLVLSSRKRESTFPMMLKDSERFLPAVRQATYIGSLFDTKTVLLQNETNDGRPILFRRNYAGIPGFSVVMGGKIDNIYDIFGAISTLRDEATEGIDYPWISRILRGDF